MRRRPAHVALQLHSLPRRILRTVCSCAQDYRHKRRRMRPQTVGRRTCRHVHFAPPECRTCERHFRSVFCIVGAVQRCRPCHPFAQRYATIYDACKPERIFIRRIACCRCIQCAHRFSGTTGKPLPTTTAIHSAIQPAETIQINKSLTQLADWRRSAPGRATMSASRCSRSRSRCEAHPEPPETCSDPVSGAGRLLCRISPPARQEMGVVTKWSTPTVSIRVFVWAGLINGTLSF